MARMLRRGCLLDAGRLEGKGVDIFNRRTSMNSDLPAPSREPVTSYGEVVHPEI